MRNEIKFESDTVSIVETNVDDVTGEVLAQTIEILISAGAYDATVSSFIGKKGRMGQTVRAVCSRENVQKLAEIMVEETGTLGVKIVEYKRLIVPRKEVVVPIKLRKFSGVVKVKVAVLGSGYRIKPELAEAKKISDQEGIPLRKVLEEITKATESLLESRS
ncbi:MAG: LarC family nickel insertion protein [Thaumarchaeota archaeon]|nr:LarC family nickel insertion protein [Nitrososphaerota archaeon]